MYTRVSLSLHITLSLCVLVQKAIESIPDKQSLCNKDPFKPHFHLVKLGFAQVYVTPWGIT